LAKDQKRRLHDIADARVDLEQAIADPSSSLFKLSGDALRDASESRGVSKLSILGLLVLVSIIAVGLTWFLKPNLPPPERRVVTQILQGDRLDGELEVSDFSISPNGQILVYVARQGDTKRLRKLSLSTGGDEPIRGTEGGVRPFFSPDGNSIGFVAKRKLMTLSLDGERPAELRGARFMPGASWGPGNRIVFSSGRGVHHLQIIIPGGGEAQALTEIGEDDPSHRWPQWLPNGQHVLFMSKQSSDVDSLYDAEVINVDTKERTRLIEGCLYARYAASGHLLFIQKGFLYALEFDLDRLELKGEPRRVGPEVQQNGMGKGGYALSDDGTLVYLPEMGNGNISIRKLVWLEMDRVGEAEEASSVKGEFSGFALSPDGQIVALEQESRIVFLDLSKKQGKLTPLSTQNYSSSHPVWIPGTRSIVFASERDDKWGVWIKKRVFEAEELLFPTMDYQVWPYSFSSDGKFLFGVAQKSRGLIFSEIWVYDMSEQGALPRFLVEGVQTKNTPVLSPGGEWLVYRSDRQVLLEPFGRPGVPLRLHDDRSGTIKWSKEGGRLFFPNRNFLRAINMNFKGGMPDPDAPVEVATLPGHDSFGVDWDFDPSQRRILVLQDDLGETDDSSEEGGPNSVRIMFNLFTELNQPSSSSSE
jgi:serine/threonine-protein kinase